MVTTFEWYTMIYRRLCSFSGVQFGWCQHKSIVTTFEWYTMMIGGFVPFQVLNLDGVNINLLSRRIAPQNNVLELHDPWSLERYVMLSYHLPWIVLESLLKKIKFMMNFTIKKRYTTISFYLYTIESHSDSISHYTMVIVAVKFIAMVNRFTKIHGYSNL